jgi:hypothetical protein
MGVKDLFARVVSGSAGRVVETPVRDIVQEAFRQAEIPSPQELQAVRAEVSRLTAEVHALRNQLSSLTDVVKVQQEQLEQAEAARANAPAPAPREDLTRAVALAQANAEALAAVSEAQAAALDAGLSAQRAVHDAAIARLEAQLAELRARPEAAAPVQAPVIEAPAVPLPTAAVATAAPHDEDDDDAAGRRGRKSLSHLHCKVPGCAEPHRSKGFCGKHYQGWRRGRIDGFVGPEGAVRDGDHAWRVDPRFEGEPVEIVGDGATATVKVNGEAVAAERVAA